METVSPTDLTRLLTEQLDWHWAHQLDERLRGLTDEEYFWEPVPSCWSVRPRGSSPTSMAAGAGDHTIDWEWPTPEPPPVTTIA